MGKEVVIFQSEEKADRARVCSFLRDLADRIEQNSVVLKKGDEETPVDIPEMVELEVKFEEETGSSGKEYSIEVELEWPEGGMKGGAVSLG
ncbi:MAG: amphi-Trp domain-containing protein [Armatimonadota bacterium]|jgi:amphi-Trp domain-containing protein